MKKLKRVWLRKDRLKLDSIPNDIINYLINNFIRDSRDIVSLSMVNKKFSKILEDTTHRYYHVCISQIEDYWNNMLLPTARNRAINLYDETRNYGRQTHCENSIQIECKIYYWKTHLLKVSYSHNPRDVEMWSWYLNNERLGWSMG